MALEEIIVAGVRAVPSLLARYGDAGLVSVTYQDITLDPTLHNDPRRVLRLRFHDVNAPCAGKVMPEASHVRELMDFHHGGLAQRTRLIVHCFKGLSRSVSVALSLAYLERPGDDPARVYSAIRALSPHAVPNARVMRLADEMLGANGVLASLGAGLCVPTQIANDDTVFGPPFRMLFQAQHIQVQAVEGV